MDTALLVVRVVLSLGLVLTLMWFIARRVNRRPAPTRGVAVDVVGRRSLGRRAGVAVVEVEGHRLVLGVSEAGVRLVADLGDVPDPAPAVRAVPSPRTARAPRREFAAVLAAQEQADDAGGPAVTPAPVATTRGSGPSARGPAARAGTPPSRPAAPRATARSATATVGGATRRPAHRGEPVPTRRAVGRAAAPPRLGGNPLAGSVLDRAVWSRARAVLTSRTAGP
jgi:flagellar protein FliO/FliZ